MYGRKFYTAAVGVSNADCGENKLIQVAEIDKPEWRESRRRVYSTDGVCPALHGIGCGGNTEPKIVDDIYNSREARIYDKYSPSLRAERTGLKVIENVK